MPTPATLPRFQLPGGIAALNATLVSLGVTDRGFEDEASLGVSAALASGKPMDLGLRVRLGIAAVAG